MNFEERLRELAEKATPGPYSDTRLYWLLRYGRKTEGSWDDLDEDDPHGIKRVPNEDSSEYIAYNDPVTAKLVADVIAAARALFDRSGMQTGVSGKWNHLESTLAALDALAATRAGTDRADAHHAALEKP